MASLDDAAACALALPGVSEGTSYGHRSWSVGGKGFAWERPLSKADVKRFGAAAVPAGPLLALAVEDLGDRQALIEAHPDYLFTIEHFSNYPAMLLQLERASPEEVREAVLDAWLVHAPPGLADGYLASS